MFTGEVEFKGFPKVRIALRGLSDKTADDVRKAVIRTSVDIRNTVILSMRNTPKTGRVYFRGKGKKRKRHVASSFGNPPAIDTGELLRSITHEARAREIEVGAEIGAPYAEYLEKGTPKMFKRPFLEPALDKYYPKELDRRIKDAIRGSLR